MDITFYRCEICGNIVALVHDGGGELVCCGQPMTKLEAQTADSTLEKHVPVVTKEDGKLDVVVGSTLHPMIPEHFIQWIALVSGDKFQMVFLKPGIEPRASFEMADSGTIYEFCNIHGLWKTDF